MRDDKCTYQEESHMRDRGGRVPEKDQTTHLKRQEKIVRQHSEITRWLNEETKLRGKRIRE